MSLTLVNGVILQTTARCNEPNSHAILSILEASPDVSTGALVKRYPYLRILLSPSEMATWLSPREFGDFTPRDLLKDIAIGGGSLYGSGPNLVLVAIDVPLWEVHMYVDLTFNLLVISNRMAQVRSRAEVAVESAKRRLILLRERIEKDVEISKKEISSLMAASIGLREEAIEVAWLRDTYHGFANPPTTEISILVGRLSDEYKLELTVDELDGRIATLEGLFDTIYSVGQEYLTLTLWVNSDIATRAFTLLNIILFGTLGLAILTATLRTPIADPLAAAGVIVAAGCAFAYFALIRYRATRSKGRLLSDHD